MKAVRGNVVTIEYTLTDDEGRVLDASEGSAPLEYLHGYDNIIPALESALDSLETGHTASVTIPPEEAYGDREPDAVFEVPREDLPEEMELRPGMRVSAQTPKGQIALTVVELTEEKAILDGNHPLAGTTLHFDVEVTDVREATEEELAQGAPANPAE